MPMHSHHPKPEERTEFLVDGCPRCEEYARDLGLHFDPARWRAFWRKMVEVELYDEGGYASGLDKELGGHLYLVALGLQRATGVHPSALIARDHLVRVLDLGAAVVTLLEEGTSRDRVHELVEVAINEYKR